MNKRTSPIGSEMCVKCADEYEAELMASLANETPDVDLGATCKRIESDFFNGSFMMRDPESVGVMP